MNHIEIAIPVEDAFIHGNLTLVDNARGIIVFVHGSGSSRFSTRNTYVAHMFNDASFSTLLFDLLTEQEDIIDQRTREYRFNIPLLAERLVTVTHWVKAAQETKGLPIGYFGASTGAAAALIAATILPDHVAAIVSRGGRPDLAIDYLAHVQAPTLLIVGQLDEEVIILNERAYQELHYTKELYIVPGATHLFEEPGTLDLAAEAATVWFNKYLVQPHIMSVKETHEH